MRRVSVISINLTVETYLARSEISYMIKMDLQSENHVLPPACLHRYAKAFAQINCFVLLNRVSTFDFTENLIKLFTRYLLDMYVTYKSFNSFIYSFVSGEPQGTNLGPLLFTLFLNDLAKKINCQKLPYADDLKIFKCIA